MRFLGFLLTTLSLLASSVFGASLSLSINQPDISVGETFSLKVQGTDLQSLDGIKIDGIEQFQIIGQQIASSYQNINGQQTAQQQVNLQLKSLKEGTFAIGPAVLQTASGSITSNALDLQIGASLQAIKEQLKGPQTLDEPVFPRKKIFALLAGIFGIIFIIAKAKAKAKPIKNSVVQEITTRPKPVMQEMNRIEKIPTDDDPLFAENSEHLLRNYLQYVRKTNVYHLTYQELLQLNSHQTGDLRIDMEALRRVLMLLQKARYAKQELEKGAIRKELEKIV